MYFGENDRGGCSSADYDGEAELHDKIHRSYFFVSLAGIGLAGSLFLFIAVVEYLARAKGPFEGFPLFLGIRGLRYILYGIAGVFIILMHGARRPPALPVYDVTITRSRTTGHERLGNLVRKTVFSFALCEAIGILGLLLFFVSGSRRDFYALFGISLLSVIVCFPRFRDWLSYVAVEQGIKGFRQE